GCRRAVAVGTVEVGQGQADLLEVVLALRAGGCLANLLDGRQEQADQDRDDGDHDEQLDQGEASAAGRSQPVHLTLLRLDGVSPGSKPTTNARVTSTGTPGAR